MLTLAEFDFMYNSTQHFNFNHLSVRDLVDARELFHLHLINKKNVVATAIGRYLIRKTDIDKYGQYRPQKVKPARSLDNSVVLDISWPCILVFISSWEKEEDLIKDRASDIIPKTIYMPDGRTVPICVILASKENYTSSTIDLNQLRFPKNYIGGGFPIFINSQGVQRIATIGCIVSDGHKYYALTNKHVAGVEGEEIYSNLDGSSVRIGKATNHVLGKVKFTSLYPGWESSNILVSCDSGLIEIEDINNWKTDVLEIGQMSDIFNLDTLKLNLSLITEHAIENGKIQPSKNGLVVGYGSVSKKIEGEIAGLFYRYRSIGGLEYVSDFLISGRNGSSLNVNHGDSGMVWHLITYSEFNNIQFQPIALHWGQHEFTGIASNQRLTFSLATNLSNICRELDVELVRGWNLDVDYSWGKTGHYKIAASACDIVTNRKLKKLLSLNKNLISFEDQNLIDKEVKNIDSKAFCPLADVADLVWRTFRKMDDANHFADMDESNEEVMNGKTLLDLCKNVKNIDIDFWNSYYEQMEAIDDTKSSSKRGALPFRIWQAFDLMVSYLKQKKLAEFVCVGGLVSHYLGDACQPLHISYLHHGNPGISGETKVHSVFETDMVDRKVVELIKGVNLLLNKNLKFSLYATGKEAAQSTIKLMDKISTNILPPQEIIDAYNEKAGRERINNMWDKLGNKTIRCFAEGAINLALFWQSAWITGGGDKNFTLNDIKEIKKSKLVELYNNKDFFPSYRLKDPKFKELFS